MAVTETGSRLEEIAQDLFEVVTQLCLASPRGRRRPGELKEIEFFTLTILQERGTMIVGEIQRLLSILPAQMSRIIRSLENRPEPLISCHINPRDKRKINVCLTEAGEKALHAYQAVRVRRIVELVRDLADDEQEQMIRLLERVRGLLERNPGA
jgi:DNA-binding MarR family transcriptional regulator